MTEITLVSTLKEQRYATSVLLSYLNENDGTSLLLTNVFWSRRVLPIFRLPEDKLHMADASGSNLASRDPTPGSIGGNDDMHRDNDRQQSKLRIKKSRHKFVVAPVQDSSVLLERLNTRRLRKRICRYKKKNLGSDCNDDGNGNGELVNRMMKIEKAISIAGCCYPFGMSTDEIAWHEWNEARLYFATRQAADSSITPERNWPAECELIRYRMPSTQPHLQRKRNLKSLQPTTPTSPTALIQSLRFQQLHNNHSNDNSKQNKSNYNNSNNSIPKKRFPPKIKAGTTLLASYPRSGNTLLRTLLERTTTLLTGSDTRPNRSLSRSLSLHHDLVGEGILSPSQTPIVKTHFPERRGCLPFTAHRVILLVRNPYDAIDSYWNMCCTDSHTESLEEIVYDLYSEKFLGLARSEIWTWCRFHLFWLRRCGFSLEDRYDDDSAGDADGSVNGTDAGDDSGREEEEKKETNASIPSSSLEALPLLVIRYEDLILDTLGVMEKVISFLLEEEDGKETQGNEEDSELHPFWKWRIRHGLGLVEESTTKDGHDMTLENSNTSSSVQHKPKVALNSNDFVDNESMTEKEKDLNEKINTMNLGSYKPRSINTTSASTATNARKDYVTDSVPNRNKLSSFGKSIRKERYSRETLRYMHDVGVTLAKIANKEEDQAQQCRHGGSVDDYIMTGGNVDSNSNRMGGKEQRRKKGCLELFGYDLYSQKFPQNFVADDGKVNDTNSLYNLMSHSSLSALEKETTKNGEIKNTNSVRVNIGSETRKTDDPYGRALFDWRKKETENDTRPFPTVSKS